MEVIQQISAASGVLVLLVATLWCLRRRGFAAPRLGNRAGGRRLETVERLSLGPQQTLHLVRLGSTGLLLASSPAGCSLVTSLPYREITGAVEPTAAWYAASGAAGFFKEKATQSGSASREAIR